MLCNDKLSFYFLDYNCGTFYQPARELPINTGCIEVTVACAGWVAALMLLVGSRY